MQQFKFYLMVCFLCIGQVVYAQMVQQRAVTLMGSRFDITIVAANKEMANKYIDTAVLEITRIENAISDWLPNSQISAVNANAGIAPVKVDKEVFELTKRALYFSFVSDGAFDISFAAMDKIWKFDGSMRTMPTATEIQKAIAKVGYQNVVLDSNNYTIFLKNVGMKIGFGATGKGYAADKARELLERKGVNAGIINASGDMATWGSLLKNKPWLIGVTNPFNEDKQMALLKFKRNAVTTSGSYEKYVEFDGKRYAHIINPKTGYPSTGLISVTVVGPSAEIANAISTSLMVLGAEKASAFAQKFPGYSFLLITDEGKVIRSENFKGRVNKKIKN